MQREREKTDIFKTVSSHVTDNDVIRMDEVHYDASTKESNRVGEELCMHTRMKSHRRQRVLKK